MKKHRILTMSLGTFALSLVATGSFAASDDNTEPKLIYSLDTGRGVTGNRGGAGTPLQQDYDVAIHISDKRFVGTTISAVRVPIDTISGLSDLKVWLTKELTLKTIDGKKENVPDILSQDVEMGKGWIEVKLEKPYTITDEGVYVGYSFKMDELNKSNRRPVRITTELHDGGLFMRSTRSYRKWQNLSDQCSSLLQVELEGAPKYAAQVLAGDMTYFGATGKENAVQFYVENHGATGVKSIDYTYEYNGKTLTGREEFKPAMKPIFGVEGSFYVTLPVVDKKAYYPVNLTITKVNDNDNTDADNTLTQDICVFDKVPTHRSVVEEYTGTWCGFCPRGYVGLAAMNRLHPDDFIALSYHNTGDKPDPMEVMNGYDYPSAVSGFPAAWIDRTYQVDAYGGFDGNSKTLGIEDVWKATCDILAEANISVKGELNADNTTASVKATVDFPLEIKNGRYGVEYVLVADGLTGTGTGWDQHNYFEKGKYGKDYAEPEFKQFIEGDSYVSGLKYDDVVLATTRLTGDNQYLPENIEEDKKYELSASFDLTKVRNTAGETIIQDPAKLRVVALLIDYNDNSVVNAAKSTYFGSTTAISNINADTDAKAVGIYDLSGRQLSSMQRGVNIVKMADGRTSKIIIK